MTHQLWGHRPESRSLDTPLADRRTGDALVEAVSWQAGRPVPTDKATTIADGIAVRDPVPVAVDWLATTIDDIVLVAYLADVLDRIHDHKIN